MEKPIADLHCHPSLKPTGNKEIKDLWVGTTNKGVWNFFKTLSVRRGLIRGILKHIATYSQSNLDNCYRGGNRLLVCSIYPFERPFMQPSRPFSKSTAIQKFILRMIFGKRIKRKIDRKIIELLTGISKEAAERYLREIYESGTINYFDDYKREYHYLKESNQSKSTNEEFNAQPAFELVGNYEEYLEKKAANIICGIITIEGMHALAQYKKSDLFEKESITDLSPQNRVALENSFKDNIQEIKTSGHFQYKPFFITFSHHFNNLISGHAKSFADATSRIKPGFADVFDQTKGMNKGMSTFAKELIVGHLLSRENGARILIDTKHMSLKARDDFYGIVSQFQQRGDAVPIICSHTAVNGIATREAARKQPDINRYEKKAYVSKYDINLTDQDIQEIFDTDGIIGICMHDGRMPGGKFKKYFKRISKMFKSKESKKRIHAQMFLTNVFHILKVNLIHIRRINQDNPGKQIAEIEAWKTISLGTDNDGIVDPFDHFNTAAKLRDFKLKLIDSIKWNDKPFMKKYKILSLPSEHPFTQKELTDLLLGLTPEEIADQIFYDNTHRFLSTYFTVTYLNRQRIV